MAEEQPGSSAIPAMLLLLSLKSRQAADMRASVRFEEMFCCSAFSAGARHGEQLIEATEIACDECPAAGYDVTDSCHGCAAHCCEGVCKQGAISYKTEDYDFGRTLDIEYTYEE